MVYLRLAIDTPLRRPFDYLPPAGGAPAGGWRPEERFTREEALRSWTWAGAYAAFEEDWKGTLEVGKVADFLVLSGDIMTLPLADLPRVKVRATYVAGKPVYSDQ